MAILHTIPYLGAAVVTGAVGLSAYLQFESAGPALAAASVPLAAAALIGIWLQTALMGRAARMNAVVVFVALLFWGMVWGGWGLLLAFPIMADGQDRVRRDRAPEADRTADGRLTWRASSARGIASVSVRRRFFARPCWPRVARRCRRVSMRRRPRRRRSPTRRRPRSAGASRRAPANIPGSPGFNLLVDGSRSFAMRLQIAEQAERTLDLQYFVFQQDDTGQLLLDALLAAADRGVRVRLLLDDAFGFDNDSMIRPLAAHQNIEIRIYNPFVIRQQFAFLRGVEYLLAGAVASTTGCTTSSSSATTRSPSPAAAMSATSISRRARTLEFGDFDLAVAGPIVRAIVAQLRSLLERSAGGSGRGAAARQAVGPGSRRRAAPALPSTSSRWRRRTTFARCPGPTCSPTCCRAGSRWSGPRRCSPTIRRTRRPPSRRTAGPSDVEARRDDGRSGVKTELIIVSPYLVPGDSELELSGACAGGACACACSRIRWRRPTCRSSTPAIGATVSRCWMTASSCTRCGRAGPAADRARAPIKSGSSGQFALHAKLFVVDRQRVFVGSMNFDRALAAHQHRNRIDHRQPGTRPGGRRALRGDRATRQQLPADARAQANAGPGPLRWLSSDQGKRCSTIRSRAWTPSNAR